MKTRVVLLLMLCATLAFLPLASARYCPGCNTPTGVLVTTYADHEALQQGNMKAGTLSATLNPAQVRRTGLRITGILHDNGVDIPFELNGSLRRHETERCLVGYLKDQRDNFTVLHFVIDTNPAQRFHVHYAFVQELAERDSPLLQLVLLNNRTGELSVLETAADRIMSTNQLFRMRSFARADDTHLIWWGALVTPSLNVTATSKPREVSETENGSDILHHDTYTSFSLDYTLNGEEVSEVIVLKGENRVPTSVAGNGQVSSRLQVAEKYTESPSGRYSYKGALLEVRDLELAFAVERDQRIHEQRARAVGRKPLLFFLRPTVDIFLAGLDTQAPLPEIWELPVVPGGRMRLGSKYVTEGYQSNTRKIISVATQIPLLRSKEDFYQTDWLVVNGNRGEADERHMLIQWSFTVDRYTYDLMGNERIVDWRMGETMEFTYSYLAGSR